MSKKPKKNIWKGRLSSAKVRDLQIGKQKYAALKLEHGEKLEYVFTRAELKKARNRSRKIAKKFK